MKRYVVRFLKDVVGGDMREHDVCQSWFEVEADDEAAAARIAEQRFCEAQNIADWRFHADRVEVVESEFPS